MRHVAVAWLRSRWLGFVLIESRVGDQNKTYYNFYKYTNYNSAAAVPCPPTKFLSNPTFSTVFEGARTTKAFLRVFCSRAPASRHYCTSAHSVCARYRHPDAYGEGISAFQLWDCRPVHRCHKNRRVTGGRKATTHLASCQATPDRHKLTTAT